MASQNIHIIYMYCDDIVAICDHDVSLEELIFFLSVLLFSVFGAIAERKV